MEVCEIVAKCACYTPRTKILISLPPNRFFESQLNLFVELEHYLNLHHNGSEEFFPEPSDVLMHGHTHLHDLIRIHGGKTLLAQRLDMKFAWDSGSDATQSGSISWGAFSLGFAVQLLSFIRSQYIPMIPPLSSAHISMPSENDLIRCGHQELAALVLRYGGYESVARRLGLHFFDRKSQWMEETQLQWARKQWKNRRRRVLNTNSQDASRRKRKGIPWDEDLVIQELLAYVQTNMTTRDLPSNVMPLFRQFDEDGRGDLKRAISKFGGGKHIAEKAGLMPFTEWKESQC